MSFPRSLERVRAAVNKTFTATADVLRKSQVPDTSGGFIDSYAVALNDVPCSFTKSIITPLERERDVRIQSISYWVFKFPSGTDIRGTDRLRVGTRIFEVSGVGEVSLSISLTITTQEIT